MKYLSIFFFFCSVVLKAQKIDSLKYEAKYLLHFQTDSTDIYSKGEEVFVLKIGNEKSLFASENTIKRDEFRTSVMKNGLSGALDLNKVPKSAFMYYIVKDIHQHHIHFYDKIYRDNFYYKEDVKLNWELTNIKEKISDLECKIAFVNYGGRRYKTWYSTEISIPEGPYKFFGLPGLIVKMEDDRGFYKFELMSFKKVSDNKEIFSLHQDQIKAKEITKAKLKEVRDNFVENMASEISKSGIILPSDAIRDAQNRQRKKNNPIELN